MSNDAIGDHRLDAMCLALGGLQLEESVFSYSTADADSSIYFKPIGEEPAKKESTSLIAPLEIKNKDGNLTFTGVKSLFKKETKTNKTRSGLEEKKISTEAIFERHGLANYSSNHKKDGWDEELPESFMPRGAVMPSKLAPAQRASTIRRGLK